ncbi:hypothetical protein K435DRAFT_795583 [Dendrothele bispora CBS 962.96]|uniref:F-box domain-containing protein n=1 Tax=Dendrothele bispora (strain CBS 962.96) TaxID=1314807 RepID=A0A4S8M9S0_DENBC|nr:hypothetical protein K435DRAFT_795583 [Dendrothele bispora CBS 962.96]
MQTLGHEGSGVSAPTLSSSSPEPSFGSIDSFPTEILIKIFSSLSDSHFVEDPHRTTPQVTFRQKNGLPERPHCRAIDLSPTSFSPVLRLSHTCRRWREIALSIPHLWSKIMVNIANQGTSLFHLVQTFLRLSKPTPLSLRVWAYKPCVGVFGDNRCTPSVYLSAEGRDVLQLLIDEHHRWYDVQFTWKVFVEISHLILGPPDPRLSRATHAADDDDSDLDPTTTTTIRTIATSTSNTRFNQVICTNLEFLQLDWGHVGPYILSPPMDIFCSSSKLHTLRLTNFRSHLFQPHWEQIRSLSVLDAMSDADEVREILLTFPCLEHFAFQPRLNQVRVSPTTAMATLTTNPESILAPPDLYGEFERPPDRLPGSCLKSIDMEFDYWDTSYQTSLGQIFSVLSGSLSSLTSVQLRVRSLDTPEKRFQFRSLLTRFLLGTSPSSSTTTRPSQNFSSSGSCVGLRILRLDTVMFYDSGLLELLQCIPTLTELSLVDETKTKVTTEQFFHRLIVSPDPGAGLCGFDSQDRTQVYGKDTLLPQLTSLEIRIRMGEYVPVVELLRYPDGSGLPDIDPILSMIQSRSSSLRCCHGSVRGQACCSHCVGHLSIARLKRFVLRIDGHAMSVQEWIDSLNTTFEPYVLELKKNGLEVLRLEVVE